MNKIIFISIFLILSLGVNAHESAMDEGVSMQDDPVNTWKDKTTFQREKLSRFFVFELMKNGSVAMEPEELENYQSQFTKCFNTIIPQKTKKYKYWALRPIKELVPACKQKIWGFTADNHHFWQ